MADVIDPAENHKVMKRHSSSSSSSAPAGLAIRQTRSTGIALDAYSLEPESVISFSNGSVVDLQPRLSMSSASKIRVSSSSASRRTDNDDDDEEDQDEDGQTDDDDSDKDQKHAPGASLSTATASSRSRSRSSRRESSTSSQQHSTTTKPTSASSSSFVSRITSSVAAKVRSLAGQAAEVPPQQRRASNPYLLTSTSTTLSPLTVSPRRLSSLGSDAPLGRPRNFTVDMMVRRGSVFLPPHMRQQQAIPIKGEHQLQGARRNSVRLSEADVGFLLGRVSRISAETLRQAAGEGNAALCEALVRGGVPVDSADDAGRTALLVAVEHGRADCVHHLLELGASGDAVAGGRTALVLAISLGKLSCLQVLVNHSSSSNGLNANLPASSSASSSEVVSVFSQCLLDMEQAMADQDEPLFLQRSQVCRILLKNEMVLHRELFKPKTLFLVDEWTRARKAGEAMVSPPLHTVIEGETQLLRFLKQHRRRVGIITVIKIWFVVMFIVFDLATRDMTMTPQRLLTYSVLYVGAYYL